MSFARVIAWLALIVGVGSPLTSWAGDVEARLARDLASHDSLLAAIETTRYRVHPRRESAASTGGYEVGNPAQRFGAVFGVGGVELRPIGQRADWRVGLRLEAWGYGERFLSPGL